MSGFAKNVLFYFQWFLHFYSTYLMYTDTFNLKALLQLFVLQALDQDIQTSQTIIGCDSLLSCTKAVKKDLFDSPVRPALSNMLLT